MSTTQEYRIQRTFALNIVINFKNTKTVPGMKLDFHLRKTKIVAAPAFQVAQFHLYPENEMAGCLLRFEHLNCKESTVEQDLSEAGYVLEEMQTESVKQLRMLHAPNRSSFLHSNLQIVMAEQMERKG
jgi:hypothetical protein